MGIGFLPVSQHFALMLAGGFLGPAAGNALSRFGNAISNRFGHALGQYTTYALSRLGTHPLVRRFAQSGVGAASGGISGFATGGLSALAAGKNFWDGALTGAAGGAVARSTPQRYGPTRNGPLPPSKPGTFRSSSYTEIQLQQPSVFYRIYGNSVRKMGGYWSRTEPAGPFQSQLDLALNPQWGNPATHVVKIQAPPGTLVYEGVAGPQPIPGGSTYQGSGNQVIIPYPSKSWEIKRLIQECCLVGYSEVLWVGLGTICYLWGETDK